MECAVLTGTKCLVERGATGTGNTESSVLVRAMRDSHLSNPGEIGDRRAKIGRGPNG